MNNPEVQMPGRLSYQQGLDLQNRIVDAVLDGSGPEALLLLEHEPVFTIGRTRDRTSLGDAPHLPFPVFETNRGGQATYHGPGQLVGYPILDLNLRGRDLHRYLRFLEGFLISLCGHYGVEAGRVEGLTGVWVGPRKIASLGVGVKRWVTMHGFALNVTRESLVPFHSITPCGIQGVTMTCLEAEGASSTDDIQTVAEALFLESLRTGLCPDEQASGDR